MHTTPAFAMSAGSSCTCYGPLAASSAVQHSFSPIMCQALGSVPRYHDKTQSFGRGWAWEKLMKAVERQKFPFIRRLSTEDIMYMTYIINITVCSIWASLMA